MEASHQMRKPPRIGRARLLIDFEPEALRNLRLDLGLEMWARFRMVLVLKCGAFAVIERE